MIGIIGGTGAEGQALSVRFASNGHEVIIGSRNESKAKDVAESITGMYKKFHIQGMTNFNTAQNAELIILTVPYYSQKDVLNEIKPNLTNKIVVNTVVPLVFKNSKVFLEKTVVGSAALESQKLLPDSFVVTAFQTISSEQLIDLKVIVDSDVLICGDDLDAKQKVISLINRIEGLRSIDTGSNF